MNSQTTPVLIHLLVAMAAGGLIGLERSYFGRPAGLRTHTLVCMASSLLMLVTLYQKDWFPSVVMDAVRVDPTRMAQGIMTGIGFLGAGVIMKEKLSVRGLTTAASIWITAAIGILAGIGFYTAVVVVTALTLGTLTLYRLIERRLPVLFYFHNSIRFRRESTISERAIREMIARHGCSVVSMGHALTDAGRYFEYNMIISTRSEASMDHLSRTLAGQDSIVEFRISPTGE